MLNETTDTSNFSKITLTVCRLVVQKLYHCQFFTHTLVNFCPCEYIHQPIVMKILNFVEYAEWFFKTLHGTKKLPTTEISLPFHSRRENFHRSTFIHAPRLFPRARFSRASIIIPNEGGSPARRASWQWKCRLCLGSVPTTRRYTLHFALWRWARVGCTMNWLFHSRSLFPLLVDRRFWKWFWAKNLDEHESSRYYDQDVTSTWIK